MIYPHKHIIVGMSGGVDSSVAAYLLKEQGHRVAGLFMKNWEEDDTPGYCAAAQDLQDAQAVCDQLHIPLHTVNFSKAYWDRVFSHFLEEYQAGRTPNPDILCNKEIKFKAFLDHAVSLGAEAIATGHYANCNKNGALYELWKGLDPQKDQSYFLHALSQTQLQYAHFPIGHLTKIEVRQIAQSQGFVNHHKKDSTGICFIGERRFKTFLQEYLPARAGAIETLEGQVIGQHEGVMYYTLGQRQGLQIGGRRDALAEPWYVVDKDITRNVLIVAQGEHPALYNQTLLVKELHWIAGDPPTLPLTCTGKTRYRQTDQACCVTLLSDGHYQVYFNEPQRAVTPGQSLVLYQGDHCLGGGVITELLR